MKSYFVIPFYSYHNTQQVLLILFFITVTAIYMVQFMQMNITFQVRNIMEKSYLSSSLIYKKLLKFWTDSWRIFQLLKKLVVRWLLDSCE